ncbi:hypothetical protein EJB05_23568, partial [Eragrostis curvula]
LELNDTDVNLVLGLPLGGVDISLAKRSSVTDEMIIQKILQIPRGSEITLGHLEKILVRRYSRKMTKVERDAFKVAAILYTDAYLLSPKGSNAKINNDLFPYLKDPDSISHYNWCGYVLNVLRESAKKVQQALRGGKKSIALEGCLVFIMVYYFDNKDFGPLNKGQHTLPRVHDYNYDYVKDLIKKDKCLIQDKEVVMFGQTKVRQLEDVIYSRNPNSICPTIKQYNNKKDSTSTMHDTPIEQYLYDFKTEVYNAMLRLLTHVDAYFQDLQQNGTHGVAGSANNNPINIKGDSEDNVTSGFMDAADETMLNATSTPMGTAATNKTNGSGTNDPVKIKIDGEENATSGIIDAADETMENDGDTEQYNCNTPTESGSQGGSESTCDDYSISPDICIPGIQRRSKTMSKVVKGSVGSNTTTKQLDDEVNGQFIITADSVVDSNDTTHRDEITTDSKEMEFKIKDHVCEQNEYDLVLKHNKANDYDRTYGTSPFLMGMQHQNAPWKAMRQLQSLLQDVTVEDRNMVWLKHGQLNVELEGWEIQTEFTCSAPMSIKTMDTLMTLYQLMDDSMYEGCTFKRWRHFVNARWADTVLDRGANGSIQELTDMLQTSNLIYNVADCCMILAPVFIDKTWSLYAWDFGRRQLTVIDPVIMGKSVQDASAKHGLNIYVLCQPTVPAADCIAEHGKSTKGSRTSTGLRCNKL